MIVGLEGWQPEFGSLFAEWGVTWTKMAVADTDNGGADTSIELIEQAADAGMTVIADLRPSAEFHQELQCVTTKADADEEVDELLTTLGCGAAETVRKLNGLCDTVEWWGEYDCPYVGGFWPNKRSAYPTFLQALYDAVKDERPEVQVWNGGYGVNFQPHFLDAICNAAPGAFDAANWHHYNISEYWPRDAEGEFMFGAPLHKRVRHSAARFDGMFTAARERMAEAGCTQPFVSSEWGMPVVTDEVVDMLGRIGLHSFVFQDGVYGLGDTQAADFFEAWMSVFEAQGFEVLIYHRLLDSMPHGPDDDGTFWGAYCGLLYADGTPKERMVKTFKRWVRKGGS
jgi:hypothetical protein